jgi:long-chain acyl-CoA synthetase
LGSHLRLFPPALTLSCPFGKPGNERALSFFCYFRCQFIKQDNSMEVRRLFDFLHYQLEELPQSKAFSVKKNGAWVSYSTQQMVDLANRFSYGLWMLGVRPGQKIGLVTYQNCPEWFVVDIGAQQVGAVVVPVYPTISSHEYEYIFNDAEVVYCFVGDGDLLDKVRKAQKDVPTLKDIFTFEQRPDAPCWEDILNFEVPDHVKAEVERTKSSISPDSLATLIYTSGTTGFPKGVMLSHHNVVSNIKAVKSLVPVGAGDCALSFLPLCHIFERAVSYTYIYMGINVYQTGTDNLGGEHGDLRAVRPQFFTSVPRLLEKVYEKIYNKGFELRGLKKALFFWAMRLTDEFEFDKKFSGWATFKRRIADRLIYSKWREALGGRVVGILTGSAPCPEKIIRTFSAAGIPIREGYGLTETSPGISINHFNADRAMIGTVGPLVDGVSVEIDEEGGHYGPGEGEILSTGPNVMMGYYKKPRETAEVIFERDGQRWLRTGDIGKFVAGPLGQPFLKITDRKKELLKTSGGKYVAPAHIENKIKEDFLVEQVMVVGEMQRFVSAIIVPAIEPLKEWCRRHEVEWTSLSEMLKLPAIIQRYQHVVDKYNPQFNHIEQIKKFVLVSDLWETTKVDGSEAELTPTMKLKRRVIAHKYKHLIHAMYQ